MKEDVLINVNAFETRVALVHNGSLQELHLQRASGTSVTGNLYRGRVARILPGMQAAFVEVGLARPGFLHVRDLAGPPQESGASPPCISTLLSEGDSLLVQVAKDPLAGKGARLTTQIALPSRSLVLMPGSSHVGVSQRIEDEAERERLRALVEKLQVETDCPYGIIVRTVAEAASRDALAFDLVFLRRMWERIDVSQRECGKVGLVYEELPVHIRVIRDLVSPEVASIRLDCAATFARVQDFIGRFMPEFDDRLVLHDEPVALFERFGVEDEIRRALDKRVPLKSGGHLLFEQTEAMITIDVNTGGFVGTRALEDTVYRTNLEAAAAIPRQLRLRNLGGIVVIDFIDMDDPEHQRQVLRALEKACENDPARIRLSDISSLGLVEMSRKRTRESLLQQMCEPCPECRGRGYARTPESTCHEIFRAILRDARKRDTRLPNGAYLIRAGSRVIDRLLDEQAVDVETLAARIQQAIRFQVEPSYGVEEFDVVLMQNLS